MNVFNFSDTAILETFNYSYQTGSNLTDVILSLFGSKVTFYKLIIFNKNSVFTSETRTQRYSQNKFLIK